MINELSNHRGLAESMNDAAAEVSRMQQKDAVRPSQKSLCPEIRIGGVRASSQLDNG